MSLAEYIQKATTSYGNPPTTNTFLPMHLHAAIYNNLHAKHWWKRGMVDNKDSFIEALRATGWSLNWESLDSATDSLFIFTKNDDSFTIDYSSKDSTTISLTCTDHTLFATTVALCEKFVTKIIPQDDGTIYSICQTSEGLSTVPVGKAGVELIVDNYRPDVIEKLRLAVADLESATPTGRLVVIDGPPGTGKTFISRAIIGMTNKSKHYLVPPGLVPQLGSPSIIPLLVRMADEKMGENHPSIFILEDADECLVPRQGDNMSYISAMLNLTDGILGRMIDIRIIVTSNARKIDMDSALMRPGRLSQHIHVDLVFPKQAETIYTRLTGKEKIYRNDMTLAEIYADAAGVNIKASASKTVGFK